METTTTTTTTTTLRIPYIQDPGHGWLEVDRKLARTILGAGFARITPYSYQRKDMVYLEEDRDAALFLEAARSCGYSVTPIDRHLNDEAPIRSYRPFRLKRSEVRPSGTSSS